MCCLAYRLSCFQSNWSTAGCVPCLAWEGDKESGHVRIEGTSKSWFPSFRSWEILKKNSVFPTHEYFRSPWIWRSPMSAFAWSWIWLWPRSPPSDRGKNSFNTTCMANQIYQIQSNVHVANVQDLCIPEGFIGACVPAHVSFFLTSSLSVLQSYPICSIHLQTLDGSS